MYKFLTISFLLFMPWFMTAQINVNLKAAVASNHRDYIILCPEVEIKNWSLFLSSSYGGRTENIDRISILRAYEINPQTFTYDSLGYVVMTNYIYRYLNFDIGGKYHFSINNKDYYYTGLSAGLCYEERTYTSTYKTIDMYNPISELTPSYSSIRYEVLEESNYRSKHSNIAWRTNLFIGLDIPIHERFDLNCEFNTALLFNSWDPLNIGRLILVPSLRAGIRYRFTE